MESKNRIYFLVISVTLIKAQSTLVTIPFTHANTHSFSDGGSAGIFGANLWPQGNNMEFPAQGHINTQAGKAILQTEVNCKKSGLIKVQSTIIVFRSVLLVCFIKLTSLKKNSK